MASIPIPREAACESSVSLHLAQYCERAGAIFLLGALSPVLFFSAIAIALLSGRTPLIAHRRVGFRGATLWMLKLRTMWDGAAPATTGWVEYIDEEPGPELKQGDDPRVAHPFARFCRRHSIDELPQLWHVALGEMSLVGPRPLTAGELRRYYGTATGEVLEAKPGLAGLWQISGRNRLTYEERRQLDLEFVRARSVSLYWKILLRTLPEVWSGENSWYGVRLRPGCLAPKSGCCNLLSYDARALR